MLQPYETTAFLRVGAGCEAGQLRGHRKRPHAGAGMEFGRNPTDAADGYDEGAVSKAECFAKVCHLVHLLTSTRAAFGIW
jgi:hypothetical protein